MFLCSAECLAKKSAAWARRRCRNRHQESKSARPSCAERQHKRNEAIARCTSRKHECGSREWWRKKCGERQSKAPKTLQECRNFVEYHSFNTSMEYSETRQAVGE